MRIEGERSRCDARGETLLKGEGAKYRQNNVRYFWIKVCFTFKQAEKQTLTDRKRTTDESLSITRHEIFKSQVATWTGLQRGSSISRFLVDSFVVVARSSVLDEFQSELEKAGEKHFQKENKRKLFWNLNRNKCGIKLTRPKNKKNKKSRSRKKTLKNSL